MKNNKAEHAKVLSFGNSVIFIYKKYLYSHPLKDVDLLLMRIYIKNC
jgi:hypothetical protein